jgi:hypothetical protein
VEVVAVAGAVVRVLALDARVRVLVREEEDSPTQRRKDAKSTITGTFANSI